MKVVWPLVSFMVAISSAVTPTYAAWCQSSTCENAGPICAERKDAGRDPARHGGEWAYALKADCTRSVNECLKTGIWRSPRGLCL